MNPRPLLPWHSGLMLAAAVLAAVPIVALWRSGDDDDHLLVLAPSSLAPLEDQLDDVIADAGGPPVEWVFAGSQSLIAQVADGVPADLVVVADETAYDGVIETGGPYAAQAELTQNRLVLAVADGNPGSVATLDDLGEPEPLIGLCAIEVPCGRLAASALASLDVTAEPDTEEISARALTAKIVAGELDAGLIYRTDALAAGLEIVVDDDLVPFVNTYFGVSNDAGRPLLDLLTSDDAGAVLADAGFGG